jgi:hypothetical protein
MHLHASATAGQSCPARLPPASRRAGATRYSVSSADPIAAAHSTHSTHSTHPAGSVAAPYSLSVVA